MKRKLILIAFAMCLTGSFVSCGDKNDRALDKLESLIKKTKETSNPQKLLELADEAAKIEESINEEELSPEQKDRLMKIVISAFETGEKDSE